MLRTTVFLVTLLFGAGIAWTQEPEERPQPNVLQPQPNVRQPQPGVLQVPEVLKPRTVDQPDTTLIDDTEASGLKSRSKDEPVGSGRNGEEKPSALSLPVGRRCTVYTTEGTQFSGLLLQADTDWFVIQSVEGRPQRTWVSRRHVLAVVHVVPEDRDDARENEQSRAESEGEGPLVRALREEAERLREELRAVQDKFARDVEESADARRDPENQQTLVEQLRQRAEEARRAAEQELDNILQRLQQANEENP